jgi:hypothetical protein
MWWFVQDRGSAWGFYASNAAGWLLLPLCVNMCVGVLWYVEWRVPAG